MFHDLCRITAKLGLNPSTNVCGVSGKFLCVVPIPKHVNHQHIFDVKLQRATFIYDIHRKVNWKSVTSLFQSFHIIESHLHFVSHLEVFL